MDTKAQDAVAIIKLHEIRSEARMRAARAWFMSEFHPKGGRDILNLLLSGEKESAFYRMVASHWDVAASLVNNGGIDEKLFLDANTEHLVVFAKLQPFLSEVRELMREPDYMQNVERLIRKVPNIEKKLENRRRPLNQWASPNTVGGQTSNIQHLTSFPTCTAFM